MGSFEGLQPDQALNQDTVRALEAFKHLTRTADGRRRFLRADSNEDRQRAFDELTEPDDDDEHAEDLRSLRGVKYETIPEGVREVLERLSDSELALLSDLDAAYVKAGLSLRSNPGSTLVH